jgi:hypothetical protein
MFLWDWNQRTGEEKRGNIKDISDRKQVEGI